MPSIFSRGRSLLILPLVLGLIVIGLLVTDAGAAVSRFTTWAQQTCVEYLTTAPTLTNNGQAAVQGDLRANAKVALFLGDTATKVDSTNPLPVSLTAAGTAQTVNQGTSGTSPWQVSVTANTAALPAGTNAIGKLAANSGVDIGDVDILSIAAGDNNIGNVDVVTLPALAAGSAIIGNVGIDQTTPGTTNGVQVNVALPAGTNAIGKLAANSGVDIGDVDVTSISAGDNNIGNVDVVTLPALVAGSAIIGQVGIDQTTPGTTDSVSIATAQGAGAAIGAISDAAVITDANGTMQQYLRGLIKLSVANSVTAQANKTTDVQVLAAVAGLRVYSISVAEVAGTPAAATGNVRLGTADTDTIAWPITLAASGSQTINLGNDGIDASAGVFLEVATGSITLSAVHATK